MQALLINKELEKVTRQVGETGDWNRGLNEAPRHDLWADGHPYHSQLSPFPSIERNNRRRKSSRADKIVSFEVKCALTTLSGNSV